MGFWETWNRWQDLSMLNVLQVEKIEMSLSRPVISRLSPNLRSHWLKETPIRFIPDFELHCYYKLQMINHAYNTQSIPEHRKSSWLKTWKLEDAKVSRVADGVKFNQGDVALEWKHSHGIFIPISSVVTINLLTLFCSGCSDSEQKPCK